MRRHPAWLLTVTTAVLLVADVVVAAQSISLLSETAVAVHGLPLVHGAALGCALMGALILERHPRQPIGWLLSSVGVVTSISLLAEAYAYWVQEADGPGSQAMGGVAAWLAQLTGGQVAVALLALMYLVAPDGHFQSRRWRYAAVLPVVGMLMYLAVLFSIDPRDFRLVSPQEALGPTRSFLVSAGFLTITAGMLLAWVSMTQRFRRSQGEERQQLRLIAVSAAVSVVGLTFLLVVQAANDGRQTWSAGVPLFTAFFLLPILFAVAVLRYRLYELDVIINRTLLVAAATVFAAVGYTALVVLAGQGLEGVAGGFWLSLGATVAVALAFQPLRRVVVRWANRAAYGERAQPYEALVDLSRQLAEAPDPDELLPAVAEAAARAVSARGALVTLDVPGRSPVTGTWGWLDRGDDGSHEEVPVATEGRTLGRIDVSLPRGRTLRPDDLSLLEALADQTAVAFGNTSLARALADHVAELDHTTRRLAESRDRLIAADDAARRALERAIAREVRPVLASLPGRIAQARASLADGVTPDLDQLVAETNRALESLRELTRGVFPAQLSRFGLEPTLRSLVERASVEARLSVSGVGAQRHSERVEGAVYFCCAEAVAAADGPVRLDLSGGDEIELRISGAWGALDLAGINDRAEAVGGRVEVSDGGVVLRIPVERGVPSPVG